MSYVVIGVLGPHFGFESLPYLPTTPPPDVLLPLAVPDGGAPLRYLVAAARLKPGVTLAAAAARARSRCRGVSPTVPRRDRNGRDVRCRVSGRGCRARRSAVLADLHGCRELRPAHRVRECRQSPARPRVGSRAGARRPGGHRREPGPHRASAAHGKPRPVDRGRCARPDARRDRDSCAACDRPAKHSGNRRDGSGGDRLAGAGLHSARLSPDRSSLWSVSGAPSVRCTFGQTPDGRQLPFHDWSSIGTEPALSWSSPRPRLLWCC